MWQVVGQSRAVSFLQRSLEKGILANAYLFTGPPHVGKMTLALELARALNCPGDAPPCGQCSSCQKILQGKHADVQIIGLLPASEADEAKSRAEISIDQIRQIQHSASLPPFEGRCRVFVIDGAGLLSTEAANCLLKTLEEPADRVLFILLAADPGLLPETVVSRCQRLELKPIPSSEVEEALTSGWSVEPEKARLLARLSHGRFGWALSAALGDDLFRQYQERIGGLVDIINAGYEGRFNCAAQLARQFGQGRGSVEEVLDLWLDFWRDLLLVKAGLGEAITNVNLESTLAELASSFTLAEVRGFIDSIGQARRQLRQNASPRLVLEVLMLDMPRRKEDNLLRR